MKTRTKLISLLCCLMLVFSVMAIPAAAASSSDVITEETEGLSLSERLALAIVEAANVKIASLVEAAKQNPNADINKLVRQTNAITQTTMFLVSLLGCEVQCIYVEHNINGQSVLIDPMIVIKR